MTPWHRSRLFCNMRAFAILESAAELQRLPRTLGRYGGAGRLPPSRWASSAAAPQSSSVPEVIQQQTALSVHRRRAAERARFGMPVWQLLGVGLFGVAWAGWWWADVCYPALSRSLPTADRRATLMSHEPVETDEHASALLADVRRVLCRHGLDLGHVALPVRVVHGLGAEGYTVKRRGRSRNPTRAVDMILLDSGLSTVQAAIVLSHEFMHAWLWLQGFPSLAPSLEEGLCELAAFLYLLSVLHQPEDTRLQCEAAELRHLISDIENNARRGYGDGFRACVARLQGRHLHDLLGYVRERGRLPPPVPGAQS
eukprot:6203873-Pleurochrysis_carterae.AAC.11